MLNRLGIILSFFGSLLVAPELIGLQRLSSFEHSLEKWLIDKDNKSKFAVYRAMHASRKSLYYLYFVFPPIFFCTGIIALLVNSKKIFLFFEQNITSNIIVMIFLVALCFLVIVIGVWLSVPMLIFNIFRSVVFGMAGISIKSVRFLLKIMSGSNNTIRKFIVRFGLVLIIVGTLLQLF